MKSLSTRKFGNRIHCKIALPSLSRPRMNGTAYCVARLVSGGSSPRFNLRCFDLTTRPPILRTPTISPDFVLNNCSPDRAFAPLALALVFFADRISANAFIFSRWFFVGFLRRSGLRIIPNSNSFFSADFSFRACVLLRTVLAIADKSRHRRPPRVLIALSDA